MRRIQYVDDAASENGRPSVAVSASGTSGPAPLVVTFDASQSSDPDGDALGYLWDFGDGSTVTGSAVIITHAYQTAGRYTATLTVLDGKGGASAAAVDVVVGSPPVGTIDAPATGMLYSIGDAISFGGSATDAEDGALPASAFHWEVLLHHNTHTHPFAEFDDVTGGTFVIPATEEGEDGIWYRIYLTVTDSSGLSSVSTVDMYPREAAPDEDNVAASASMLTIESEDLNGNTVTGMWVAISSPDGAVLQEGFTPLTFAGSPETTYAVSVQNFGGIEFNRWEDGNMSRNRSVFLAGDITMTAYYYQAG